jgi:putative aldouronate transport system substrate-binding protein
VPEGLTDREGFIYGYDDRQFLFPGYKEGVRVLNKWYNMGLINPDFYLNKAGDSAEADNVKAGNVGSFIHNWDEPYRNGDNSWQAALKVNVNADAAIIAIDPFTNDAGLHRKFVSNAFDRKVFFPVSNKEPLASALYVNWISRLDVIKYLQIGDEGIVHNVLADGAIEVLDKTGTEYKQNSPQNIDYTMTVNGLHLGDAELTGKSIGLGYAPVDPFYIGAAYVAAQNDARVLPNYNVGSLTTVSATALAAKRDETLNKAIVATPEQFDAVYDAGYDEYLRSDGQAIIDERTAAFDKYIGSN